VVSGFIGIINLDGSPVDSQLLQDLTHFLCFRGPDAQDVWCQGPVGLGHALLQITSGTPLEKQPVQLDGRLWIVADARIDARAELIGKLKGKSHTADSLSLSSPDAELILHAYGTWGEACVEHLLGDFSFAIWDATRRRLFCARDHFGVKLLYYSHIGSTIVFSNTLDCLRQHPAVSDRLNDLAIADFLIFDSNQDPATTSFVDVQRLPPAHVLTCEQGKSSVQRYWELSVTTPIHYSRDAEYVERFRELLDIAVADRLRTETAGVRMSGGLDSSTVAASAQRVFTQNGSDSGLHAYTEVFDSLIPHEERYYAKLVADALKIPIQFLVCDEYRLFDCADHSGNAPPEPMHSVLARSTQVQLRHVAASSRVVLTGDGADPGLSGRISVHFRQLFARKEFSRALGDAARYFTVEGRLSRLYLRTRWRLLMAPMSQNSLMYPGWLEEGLEKRLGLRDRWEFLGQPKATIAAVRPEAHHAIVDSTWPNMFEEFDSGLTGIPVEARFPFFDLRLASFLLAMPRLPWCCDKQLLREAGRGVLPEAIRLRPKSPLRSDPLTAHLRRPEASWVDHFEPVSELGRYVVRSRIPVVHGESNSWTAWIHLRPLSLNFWLRRRAQ
jgi:asparagine synthase (glutamine-hydrolysing)